MGRRNDDRLGIPLEEVHRRRAELRARLARNRRLAARLPSTPAELGAARKEHLWIYVYCGRPRCRHHAIFYLTPLIVRWGPEASVDLLRRAARCTRCGHKGATVAASNAAWPTALTPIFEDLRWTGREVWPVEVENVLDYKDYSVGLDPHSYFYHPVLGEICFDKMCNLYSQTRTRDAVRAWFRVADNRCGEVKPLPAIFPRTVAPIVRLAPDGERELVEATWGFPLLRKGYAPKPVTNIRDDGLLDSPFWRPSFEARRCLVPASSYCEPDSNKPAGWHWFALRDETEPRPLFAFPGVWKRYRGPMKKDGPEVETDVYAFLTTKPNALTATVMHDRMPVLLSEPEELETWLSGSPEEAFRLVRTFDAERMRIVQSGAAKEDLLSAISCTNVL